MMRRGSFRYLTVTLCCVALLLAAIVPFGHAPVLAVLPAIFALDAPAVQAFSPTCTEVTPPSTQLARTPTPRGPPLA
jgi:hypothetical protein